MNLTSGYQTEHTVLDEVTMSSTSKEAFVASFEKIAAGGWFKKIRESPHRSNLIGPAVAALGAVGLLALLRGVKHDLPEEAGFMQPRTGMKGPSSYGVEPAQPPLPFSYEKDDQKLRK